YYSDRIKKEFDIDLKDMCKHLEDRQSNNLIFEFYLKVSDFEHYIELGRLNDFCKDYITKNVTPKVTPTETPKIQTQINDPLKEKISNEIEELIKMMHVTGWEKVFWSEEDYESYKKVIIEFFTTNDYSIPNLKIKIRSKSKTNIIGIFKKLHNKYSLFAGHMKDDTKLFEIVKILDKWSNNENTKIFKRISSDAL
ncbi:MAG: hypothetical protein WBP08_01525, partial [Saprospiraceae bacterium]